MTTQTPLPFSRSLELKVKMTDVRGKSPDDCIRRAIDIATRQGMTVVGIVNEDDLRGARPPPLGALGEVELRHLNMWITQAIYVAERQPAASPEGKVAWMLVAQLEQRIAQVAEDPLVVQVGQLGCVQALIAAGEPQQARSYVSTLNLDAETLQRAEEMLGQAELAERLSTCLARAPAPPWDYAVAPPAPSVEALQAELAEARTQIAALREIAALLVQAARLDIARLVPDANDATDACTAHDAPASMKVSDTDTLLPCPFCGECSEANSIGDPDESWEVYCTQCNASVWGENRKDAISAWNQRT